MELQNELPTAAQSMGRLPWHKPEIHRLKVTLDTRDSGGSEGDGAFGTPPDLLSPV